MTRYKSPLIAVTRNNKSNIVGVSGGTLLILLVQKLPEGYHYKSWLVAAVPVVNTSITFLWKLIIQEFLLFKNKRNIRRKRIIVTQEVDEVLNHPNISSQVKESLRAQWEKIQLVFVQEQIRQLNMLMESP